MLVDSLTLVVAPDRHLLARKDTAFRYGSDKQKWIKDGKARFGGDLISLSYILYAARLEPQDVVGFRPYHTGTHGDEM